MYIFMYVYVCIYVCMYVCIYVCIHIIFSVRHSSALVCFVKQPSFVLKDNGCNLVPQITDSPSAIFPNRESLIPETFLYAVIT
jgi:hypothetical protein